MVEKGFMWLLRDVLEEQTVSPRYVASSFKENHLPSALVGKNAEWTPFTFERFNNRVVVAFGVYHLKAFHMRV